MKRNRNYINEMKKDLGLTKNNKKRSMFMESILCDDDSDMLDSNTDDIDQTFQEEPESLVNDSAEDEFKSIRKIALKGIARLSDNPTDANYNTLKKIWGLCDKALEDIMISNNDTDGQMN